MDLSIDWATPVQAALTVTSPPLLPSINGDAQGDLVLGKATAFIVRVAADRELPSGINEVEVAVDFQGGTIRSAVPRGSFTRAGANWVAEVVLKTLAPNRPGPGQRVRYSVHPVPGIKELHPDNNEAEQTVEVKATSPLEIAFVPIPDCSLTNCYRHPDFSSDSTVTGLFAQQFLEATYPVQRVTPAYLTERLGNPDQTRRPKMSQWLTAGIADDLF